MNSEEKIYNNLFIFSSKIGIIFTIIPILLVLFRRKKLNQSLWIFLFYLLATIGVNLLEQGFIWIANNYTSLILPYLKKFQISDVNFLNIFFRLADYIGLGLFFGSILEKNVGSWVKKISYACAAFAIVVYFFIDGYNQYGVVNPLMDRIYVIVLPLLYIKQVHQSEPTINLWKNSYFLISLGVLIPELFSMIMSFTGDKLYETDFILFIKLSLVRNLLTVLAQFAFAYAFYQARYLKFLDRN